jgi:glycosyltransferase A (GT-A) superfamily protein (DUF2064 family)
MSAHQGTEAARPPVSIAEKAAAFENELGDFVPDLGEEEEDETPTDEAEPDDIDLDGEDELEEGEDDEGDEPDVPAIDPPVSLNAEEKEVFAQLPPEAQQAWAASETRRNAQVQEATTRASEAQRVAEAKAAQANAQAEALLAEQLQAVLGAFAPVEPDPANFADIRQYQHAKANYDFAKAQHEQFGQQVAQIGKETPEAKAARIQARDQQLLTIPEVADPATRDQYIQSAFSVAAELGYDQADLSENMDAGDLKALAQAAKWKADSEELARIRVKSKERVRDKGTGKFRSMKPGSAPHGDPRRGNAVKSFDRLKQLKAARAARRLRMLLRIGWKKAATL